MLRIGETIDRYRIEALIGQGGMAAVYKARHLTLESEHAIKVLFITAPLVRARLLREGRVQAQLRHPNIVSVTDVLEVQGAPALVMEFIDGPPLDAWLRENKPNLDQALWLFRGILRGISVAHERGVVHRDLKPANVLLAPRPEGFVPKVTDFGLVKSIAEQADGHTQTGMSLGTPEYMSPEQIRDASDTDQRADMWALGCILYELVCHRRAFSGADKMSTFNAIVAGTYPPIDNAGVHDTVAEAIEQLLVVDRDKRLSSTDALFQVLYEESEPRLGRLSPPPKPVEPLLVSGPLRSGTTPLAASPPPVPKTPGGLGEGPTGRPAQQRESVPRAAGRGDSPLSRRDTEELRLPSYGRARARLVALSVAAALVLVVAAGWWLRPAPAAETPPIPAPRTAPATPEPSANASGTPVPAPVPEPVPEQPKPTTTTKPAPAPAHPGGKASITFSGDATSVWLESGGRRIEPGPSVAPGRYNIVADFGDPQPAQAGTVDLREGDTKHLKCNAFLQKCAPPN